MEVLKTGSSLEGFSEYNMPIRESLQLGLWARGAMIGPNDLMIAAIAIANQSI